MTVLFLKYVPRKYKLDNGSFLCSGESSTETKGTAQGPGRRACHLQARPLLTPSTLTSLQLCKEPQWDIKAPSIKKLQLGLKTDWCLYF